MESWKLCRKPFEKIEDRNRIGKSERIVQIKRKEKSTIYGIEKEFKSNNLKKKMKDILFWLVKIRYSTSISPAHKHALKRIQV